MATDLLQLQLQVTVSCQMGVMWFSQFLLSLLELCGSPQHCGHLQLQHSRSRVLSQVRLQGFQAILGYKVKTYVSR